jgi:DNA-binding transcriptional regulator PaaX
MSRSPQENNQYSKKILKILSENRAVSLPDLADSLIKDIENGSADAKKGTYALNRSLKGLIDGGLIESHFSGQNDYARLTRAGRRKATSLKLESDTALLNPNWDGQWRIVLLDLPESRKSEREALRYLLKKAGFELLKNSAWISPFPYEHLFMNIKKDLDLTTEMMIIVTDSIDEETKNELFKLFQK